MELTYDSQADALNIVFKKGKVFKTVELAQEIILDLDRTGKPLNLEIIGARKKVGIKGLSEFTIKNLAFAT